jgi:phosphopantetheinyl transferase
MSLFLKKKLNDATLGVWEIKESVEELWKSVNLTEQELKYYSYLRSDTRRQHWLSYRLILPHLLKVDELTGIQYDESGKPFLNNGLKHISVTHSGRFSALIASTKKSVGIDMEQMSPKIFKVAHKFLNDCELRIVFSEYAMEGLYVIWAAKEALFKLYGKRDIQFREDIRIFPFEFLGQGTIKGEITGKDETRFYEISYQTLENYILVYAVYP